MAQLITIIVAVALIAGILWWFFGSTSKKLVMPL